MDGRKLDSVGRWLAMTILVNLLVGEARGSPGDAGRARETTHDSAINTITAEAIRDHVAILASDAYTGRLAGTAGEDSTLAYLERQYRSLGLEPIVDGSYRQRVPLVRRTVLPTPEVRLSWVDDLLIGSNRLDEQLIVSGAEIVFVGYGISAPELGWDDYAGLDMRGKVALALGSDPGREPADTTLFGGRAVTHCSLTQTKQEATARHGAVGLIAMHDQEIVSYPFSILTAAAGRSGSRSTYRHASGWIVPSRTTCSASCAAPRAPTRSWPTPLTGITWESACRSRETRSTTAPSAIRATNPIRR